MNSNLKKIFIFTLAFTLAIYYHFVSSSIDSTNKNYDKLIAYKKDCLNLFKELNNPDPSLFHRPPLAKPPDHLMNEFTQNGEMPIKSIYYFNQVYSDSNKK